MKDPCLEWGDNYILLNAKVDSPFKLGFPNPRGWLAYWLEGCLFVKHAEFDTQANYYDMGSSTECYCNDQFLELETLGPITTLAPGDTVSHTETWELFGNVEKPDNEDDARHLAERLGLGHIA
jgi:hypothetical protein